MRRIDLALKVSRDQAPSGMFNKGVFLTLTSSRGGYGPAIQASGPVKIRFVDVDTLPGLLGLSSRGFTKGKYVKRKINILKEVVNEEPSQLLNSFSKLVMHKSRMSEALKTNRTAKEMAGWPDDSESALLRNKSAIEMAVGVQAKDNKHVLATPTSAQRQEDSGSQYMTLHLNIDSGWIAPFRVEDNLENRQLQQSNGFKWKWQVTGEIIE